MGSQTFDILRQGFWASFTGGWFFDPHQDIFCNTVHMYFWLGLLLTPFVLYLTAETTIIPSILYPSLVFLVFATIKVMNYKLHILFDGEELLEDKKNENPISLVEVTSAFDYVEESNENDKNSGNEIDEEPDISSENDKSAIAETLSHPQVSIKDEIENALRKEGIMTEVHEASSQGDIEEDKSVSINELVLPHSPRVISPEKKQACIVDLHYTMIKTNDKDGETLNTIDDKGEEPDMDTDSKNKDNDLIIANKPTVTEFDKVSPAIQSKNVDSCLQQFPLNLHKLLDSSSDSSWDSYSSDISVESILSSNKVDFIPIDYKSNPQQLMIDNNIGEVKSENNLIQKPKEVIDDSLENPKAVSLSALSKEKMDNKRKQGITTLKGNNDPNFGLSLPALSLNEFLEENISFDSPISGANGQQGSAPFMEGRPSITSDDIENDIKDLADILENEGRPIRRRGAFREGSTSSRTYNRLHPSGSGSPGASLLQNSDDGSAKEGKHIAMSYEDTSRGAVHCFQDEFGHWFSYAFGDGEAVPLPRNMAADELQGILFGESQSRRRSQARESSTSNLSNHDLDTVIRDFTASRHLWRSQFSPFNRPSLDVKVDHGSVKKKYYMLPIICSFSVKVSFDRLALLALLDRNKNFTQSVFAVILATLTALLGYMLLTREYFDDFWLFTLCFVIAKCQFSLLKSVQPDSASPIHGHNNTVTFSRAIYFCITAILIIGIDEAIRLNTTAINIYGLPVYSKTTLEFARDLLIAFILAFPVIFLLGLLPQIDTFTMHILEQIHIHVFGGSALTDMIASFFSICRCIIMVLTLSGICYVPLKLHEGKSSIGQHAIFSVYCGVLIAISYSLSRATSSPEIIFKLLKNYICKKNISSRKSNDEVDDPLPDKLLTTVKTRLIHDAIVSFMVAFIVFAVHLSTVFSTLQPTLSYVVISLTGFIGIVIHYIIPQLRKQLPWLLLSSPVLKSYEYMSYEWQEPSKIMWFEKMYVWVSIIEKNILYPIVCMSELTRQADQVVEKFGILGSSFIMSVTALKFLQYSFGSTPRQHIILIWTVLLFNFDYAGYSETFLIDYFFMSILVEKLLELYLKFKFILTYTAPWQILWGSAFHAFAQPVSVPHCGMLFLQAVVSAFFSAPLNPFLGSAIFITSYMRPIKFWEKNYNTKRVDHSNTRLSSHIDSNPGADDNNLNSIFYEHLTRSLQHSLCGDLLLGRLGNFSSGDCFIMASDYLNALVHIIEVGNGYITFQLRGLEFRGTYCQQREVEAITENVDDDMGCCCCQPGHLQRFLSFNTAFSQRWLAWEVTQTKYIVEGYSVSDNTATSMFQMFDLRKIFISYYVTSIIFYCVRNEKLKDWLSNAQMMCQLDELKKQSYIDLDMIFRPSTDKDYDLLSGGITRQSFCKNYHEWLICCNRRRDPEKRIADDSVSSDMVTLCFALSLLGRRLLSTASNTLKSFLHGLHALFKGDFRVTAAKDEWVFTDPELSLLRTVVAPAVRMALKLHQDHFTCADEFDDNDVLYDAISQHEDNYVICHEGHPEWRQAVLNNKSNLLALRYVIDDGSDDYKIIMLTKRCLNFRVIKVNKECVRGLWAGQLQELIFLRNRNPERGSIQNAKQALRNMINSSCDQPIGYPIYVSPLTTSYCETNSFYSSISLGNVNGNTICSFFNRCYRGLVNQYAGHCSRDANIEIEMSTYQSTAANTENNDVSRAEHSSLKLSMLKTGKSVAPSKGLHFSSGSYSSLPTSSNSSSASSNQGEGVLHTFPYFRSEGKVRLKDITCVTEALNSHIVTELQWPNLAWFRQRATSSWDGWYPHENMIGDIIYQWTPNHPDINRRSHIDRKILLLKVEDFYIVPILEDGVVYVNSNNKELEV